MMIDQKLKFHSIERKKLFKPFFQGFIVTFAPLLIIVENAFGGLSRYKETFLVEKILMLIYLINIACLLLLGENYLFQLEKISSFIIKKISNLLSIIILSVLFLMNLPWGWWVGRKKLIRNRPYLSSWVNGGEWRNESWDFQNTKIILKDENKGKLPSLYFYFISKSNIYFALLVTILLIISILLILLNSSYVAPFLYTIF